MAATELSVPPLIPSNTRFFDFMGTKIIKEKEIIKENMDEQLKLYSVADVAKLWHIEQSKIRKLIQIGEIRAIKFSKQGLKITAKELQRFLDENENNDFSNLLDC